MATEMYAAFIVYQNFPHPGVQLALPPSPGRREKDGERVVRTCARRRDARCPAWHSGEALAQTLPSNLARDSVLGPGEGTGLDPLQFHGLPGTGHRGHSKEVKRISVWPRGLLEILMAPFISWKYR